MNNNIAEAKRYFFFLLAFEQATNVRGGMRRGGAILHNDGDISMIRDEAWKIIDEMVKLSYHKRVDRVQHARNIEWLARNISRKCKFHLHEGRFRIGVTQKLFNLYLKFLWAGGTIRTTPPDCTFDSRIINDEGLWKRMPRNPDDQIYRRWTISDCMSHYEMWADAAKSVADEKGFKSSAEWELVLYNETWKGKSK